MSQFQFFAPTIIFSFCAVTEQLFCSDRPGAFVFSPQRRGDASSNIYAMVLIAITEAERAAQAASQSAAAAHTQQW